MRFILSSIFLFFSIHAFADIDVSKNVEVYQGEGNLKVTVVRVLPLESNKALLEVSGIDHELADLVFMYDLKLHDGNRRLTTQIYGRSYNSFVESSGWSSKNQVLYMPGVRDGFDLVFDSEASDNAKSSSIVKRHKKQVASGKLAAISEFSRSREQASINASILKKEQRLESSCGKAVKLNVNWESISDDTIKAHSVSAYCGEAVDIISSFCGKDDKKAWVVDSIDAISCEFGDSLRLKLESKNLIFKTVVDEPNQADFIRQNLRNIM